MTGAPTRRCRAGALWAGLTPWKALLLVLSARSAHAGQCVFNDASCTTKCYCGGSSTLFYDNDVDSLWRQLNQMYDLACNKGGFYLYPEFQYVNGYGVNTYKPVCQACGTGEFCTLACNKNCYSCAGSAAIGYYRPGCGGATEGSDQQACTNAQPGQYYTGSGTSATNCPVGNCAQAATGRYYTTGNDCSSTLQCNRPPPGYYWSGGGTTASNCPSTQCTTGSGYANNLYYGVDSCIGFACSNIVTGTYYSSPGTAVNNCGLTGCTNTAAGYYFTGNGGTNPSGCARAKCSNVAGFYYTGMGTSASNCPKTACTNTPAGNYYTATWTTTANGCTTTKCANIAGRYYTAVASSSSNCATQSAACINFPSVGQYYAATWTLSATGCTFTPCTNAANGQLYSGAGTTISNCPVTACTAARTGQYYTTPNACTVATCNSPTVGKYWTSGGGTTASSCNTGSCSNALVNQYYTSPGFTSASGCNVTLCTNANGKQYYSGGGGALAPATNACPTLNCSNTPQAGYYWSQGGGTLATSCKHATCSNVLANNQYYSSHGDISPVGCAVSICKNTLPFARYWSRNGFNNATGCAHTACSNLPLNAAYVTDALNLNSNCLWTCNAGYALDSSSRACPACTVGTYNPSRNSTCSPCVQGVHYPLTTGFVKATTANTACDWDCVGGFLRDPAGHIRCLPATQLPEETLVLPAFAVLHDQTPTHHLLRLLNLSLDLQTTETLATYPKSAYTLALPTVHHSANFLCLAEGANLTRVSTLSLARPFNPAPARLTQNLFSGISSLAFSPDGSFLLAVDQGYRRISRVHPVTGNVTLLLDLTSSQRLALDLKFGPDPTRAYLAAYAGPNFYGAYRSPHFTCPANQYYSSASRSCKNLCPLMQAPNAAGACVPCDYPVPAQGCGRVRPAATAASLEFPVSLTPNQPDFQCAAASFTGTRTTCYQAANGSATNCPNSCSFLHYAADRISPTTGNNRWLPTHATGGKQPAVTVDFGVPVIPKKLRFQYSGSTTSTAAHSVGYSPDGVVLYQLSAVTKTGTLTAGTTYDIALAFATPYRYWFYRFTSATTALAVLGEYALVVQCQPGSYSEVPVDPYYCLQCPEGTYSPAADATTCLQCPAGKSGNGLVGQASEAAACVFTGWEVAALNLTSAPSVSIITSTGLMPFEAIAVAPDGSAAYVAHASPANLTTRGVLKRINLQTGTASVLMTDAALLSVDSLATGLAPDRLWALSGAQRAVYQLLLGPASASLELQYGSLALPASPADDYTAGPQHLEAFSGPVSLSVWKCQKPGQDCVSNWQYAPPCLAGTFSLLGTSACQPCPPGTASAALQATACGACLLGSFSASLGSLQCSACTQPAQYPFNSQLIPNSAVRTACDYQCNQGFTRVSDLCVVPITTNEQSTSTTQRFPTTTSTALTTSTSDILFTTTTTAPVTSTTSPTPTTPAQPVNIEGLIIPVFAVVHDQTPTQHLVRLVNLSLDRQTTETVASYNKTDYNLAVPAVHPSGDFVCVAVGTSLSGISKIKLSRPFDSTLAPLAGSSTVSGFAHGNASASRFFQISTMAFSPDGSFLLVVDQNFRSVRRVDLLTGDVAPLLDLTDSWRLVLDLKFGPDPSYVVLASYVGRNYDGSFRVPQFSCPGNQYYSAVAGLCKPLCHPLWASDASGKCMPCDFPIPASGCGRVRQQSTPASLEFPLSFTPNRPDFKCGNVSLSASFARTTCNQAEAESLTNCPNTCFFIHHVADHWWWLQSNRKWISAHSTGSKQPYIIVDYGMPVVAKKLRFHYSGASTCTGRHIVGFSQTGNLNDFQSLTFTQASPSDGSTYDISLSFVNAYRYWYLGFSSAVTSPAELGEYVLIIQCQPGSYLELYVEFSYVDYAADPYYCLQCPEGTYSTTVNARGCVHCPAGKAGNGQVGQTSEATACVYAGWEVALLNLSNNSVSVVANADFLPIKALAVSQNGSFAYVAHQSSQNTAGGVLKRVNLQTGAVSEIMADPILLSVDSMGSSLAPDRLWALSAVQRSVYQLQMGSNSTALEVQYGSLARTGSIDDLAMGLQHTESFTSPTSLSVWRCQRPGHDCVTDWQYSTPCLAGTFGSDGVAKCQACPPGSASRDLQAQSCSQCNFSSFAPSQGSRQCLPCTQGLQYPWNSQLVANSTLRTACEYQCNQGFNSVDGACVWPTTTSTTPRPTTTTPVPTTSTTPRPTTTTPAPTTSTTPRPTTTTPVPTTSTTPVPTTSTTPRPTTTTPAPTTSTTTSAAPTTTLAPQVPTTSKAQPTATSAAPTTTTQAAQATTSQKPTTTSATLTTTNIVPAPQTTTAPLAVVSATNTTRPFFIFTLTVPIASLTQAQLQAYTLAVARALGISPSLVLPYYLKSGARRLLGTSDLQFKVLMHDPAPRGRRLLQSANSTLSMGVYPDTLDQLYAWAAQVSAASFQANLTDALLNIDPTLAPATIDPQSVQIFNAPPPPTQAATTQAATTQQPTTSSSTTAQPTTSSSTSAQPTTSSSTTAQPTTSSSTTAQPTTSSSTTAQPTTSSSTTAQPTTSSSTTAQPTTSSSTTAQPTTSSSTTAQPTTSSYTPAQPAQPTTSSSSTRALFTTLTPSTTQPAVNTTKPFFIFTLTIPFANPTPLQVQAYTLAVARALGISPSQVSLYLKQGRRLLSDLSDYTQLVFKVDYSASDSNPSLPTDSRRRLLEAVDTQLTIQVDSGSFDAENLALFMALYQEILSDAFQANLNQASSELGLAPAVVDTSSVQIFHVEIPPPTAAPTTTPAPPPDSPEPPPPSFSAAPTPREDLDTTAGVLIGFLTLLTLAYILPSDCDEPWDP